MQFQRFRGEMRHAHKLTGVIRNISSAYINDEPPVWESFVRLWERANLVRELFWNQEITDERVLLTYLLARLRGLYNADFCYGYLTANGHKLAEAGLPEAAVSHLPEDFTRLCLNLIVNSRAPVASNKVRGGLGFRSAVVVPLAAAVGSSFGFLLLGHSTRKSYSSAELFLLQALAAELSWAVRALSATKCRQQGLAVASHHVKNSLQVILGNTALVRLKLSGAPAGDLEKHLQPIESSAQEILDRLNMLSAESPNDKFETIGNASSDITGAVDQAIAACRRVAAERGVDIEVVYVPEDISEATLPWPLTRGVLDVLVRNAVLATRSEIIRLLVQRDADRLELIVKGMESNRVAEKLNSLIKSTLRVEGARDEGGQTSVRKYLKDAGGDVYLRSRPAETAEFIVC
ncbi:MAG TPA: GAF domain-containing protein [Candidatus Binatia bacterium]